MNAGLMKLHGYSAEDVSSEASEARRAYAEELMRLGRTEAEVLDAVVRKFGIGIGSSTLTKVRAKVRSEQTTPQERLALVERLLKADVPQRKIVEIVRRDTGAGISIGFIVGVRRRLGLSKHRAGGVVANAAEVAPIVFGAKSTTVSDEVARAFAAVSSALSPLDVAVRKRIVVAVYALNGWTL